MKLEGGFQVRISLSFKLNLQVQLTQHLCIIRQLYNSDLLLCTSAVSLQGVGKVMLSDNT